MNFNFKRKGISKHTILYFIFLCTRTYTKWMRNLNKLSISVTLLLTLLQATFLLLTTSCQYTFVTKWKCLSFYTKKSFPKVVEIRLGAKLRDQSRILADEQHGIFALGVWGIQGMQVCIEYWVLTWNICTGGMQGMQQMQECIEYWELTPEP